MRWLIPCAGQAKRWAKHGNVPKQLVVLRGEPILHRLVRLANEVDPDAEVRVVVADHTDDTFKVPGSRRVKARLDPDRVQADKLLSSAHLWADDTRTIALYGDVYFTDDAIARIAADTQPWAAFARYGASDFTGKDHRELFGFAFDPSEHDRIRDAADRCLALHRAGRMGGWSGGWQIYAAAAGADEQGIAGRFVDRGNAVEVDDWTDDFDYPKDWDEWCLRWAKAPLDRRAVGHPQLLEAA